MGRRLLQALTGLDRARPLALVIDDAHAADLDSLRALLFALRRLSDQPVMTVLMRRPEAADLPEGLVRLAECARTGFELPIGPMLPAEVQDLAAAVGVPGLPLRTAYRMCAHTLGNPRHLVALLAELPVEAWSREMVLPAPRLFSRSVVRTLDSCADAARRLVEAVAVLGEHADLSTAAAIADVDEPLVALEEACRAGLLTTPHPTSAWHLAFPDPLVGAAVYGQLGRPGEHVCTWRRPGWPPTTAPRGTTERWQPSDRWRTANSASAPGDEVPQVPAELVDGFLGACRGLTACDPYFPTYASVAAMAASVPVRRVGWIAGAKVGLWFPTTVMPGRKPPLPQ